MDPRLVRLYQDELACLRELGREFAHEHPKIAARLDLGGIEVADPHVERLLEGFAFLAARVRLRLESEQPRLADQLLAALYPNFAAPVPSMIVAQFVVDPTDPNLLQGHALPRGSAVHSTLPRGEDTCCEFRTASALTLWPLTLADVRYFSHAPELGLNRFAPARAARGGLRIRLRAGDGVALDRLPLDRLAFHVSAPDDDLAFALHELIAGSALGTLAGAPGALAPAPGAGWRDAASVRTLGFDDDEALLPVSLRGFSGHRLLQEVAAMPQRLLFFEVGGLRERLAAVAGREFEIVLLFGRGDPALEARVDGDSLALHCTPAVNLFPKRLDRIALTPGGWEFHALPDRTRPLDFEVHEVLAVTGHGPAGDTAALRFQPLYHAAADGPGDAEGWYTLRRETRRLSQQQREQGLRVPSYPGEEVFVSLLDPGHGPYREALRQLAVQALVTNRDLPLLLPQALAAGDRGWRLESPGPVQAVRCLRGPTRPHPRRPDGRETWLLLAQLARHHVTLGEGDDAAEANAAQLRELLRLHGAADDAAAERQAQGIRRLRARRVVRRLPFPGPLCFGSGVELELEVDEQAFTGASAFVVASALERWFARHAAVNSFTQLTLTSAQRGERMRWPPRVGTGALA